MCRWIGYYGNPIRPELLLYESPHSLIEQSRRAVVAIPNADGSIPTQFTNGDGFGLGWYGSRDEPGVYHSVQPAWGDSNLREIAGQIESGLFLAHVRAATGTPVQQTNCHPFRHGRWLFVHNGFIDGFLAMRRELILAVDPEYFPGLLGTTDSELLFYLALTFGLEDDPLPALERMAGYVEAVGRTHDVATPLQMTIGVSNGERLYAVRYASGPYANSLFVSNDAATVRELYPDRFGSLGDEARAVVSEPLTDLPGVWTEVPPSSAIIVQPGADEELPFAPRPPTS